jgi:dTDP-4-amino-4,6-dideoxygalactose transaminase
MRNFFPYYNFTSGATTAQECAGALLKMFNVAGLRNGKYIARFENAVASCAGSGKAFAFSAGRMALYAILNAIREEERDEIILPAYTCVVVPTAILYAGCQPVYVDIEPATFNLSVEEVRAKLSARTRAIIAPHNFGIPCRIDEILKIARERNIVVIEDCAHALGSTYRGRPLGSFGDFAFISTDHTKVISTSIGGVALVNNAAYEERLETIYHQSPFLSIGRILQIILQFVLFHWLYHPRVYRLGRIVVSLYHRLGFAFFLPGGDQPSKPEAYPFPARLSNIQCWIGCQQMEKIVGNLAHRKRLSTRYAALLQNHFITQQLDEESEVAPLRFAFLVRRRESFRVFLKDFLKVESWFDNVFQNYDGDPRALGYQPGSCPVAEKISQMIVNLPTHLRIEDRFFDLLKRKLQNEERLATFSTQRHERGKAVKTKNDLPDQTQNKILKV